MITALFGLACAGVLALAWPSREERAFACLLAASWLATVGLLLLPQGAWSYAAAAIDSVVVMAAAAALAIAPRPWLGVLATAALGQFCAHLLLQASDGSPLDRWRYLVALDALFAVQLAAAGAPGAARQAAQVRARVWVPVARA